ncbi:hypothetical protein F2Q70_00002946 [Brassica cretica]|uniref:Uncharacterized protein n=1 Tax=Brassica cretica TaxID=69181 RepID=A0A8S9J4V0_BRACR|nr:hypothetical protein F2Q70_00002946 [Brassica cretica]
MEIPPRDQTSLGERRGEIGRREKGSRVILNYHLFLASQMVSGNPECAADASQSHLQSGNVDRHCSRTDERYCSCVTVAKLL